MLEAGDVETLGWFLFDRFGVITPEEKLCEWCALAKTKKLPREWTDSTVVMWIKNRLTFSKLLPEGKSISEIRAECTMHCFFMYLEETPEMLERIKPKVTEKKAKSGPARSKVGKTLLEQLFPVNRVAARVVPEE